jgi:hypothetical protein
MHLCELALKTDVILGVSMFGWLCGVVQSLVVIGLAQSARRKLSGRH